jgi:hypothetical protein
MSSALRALLLIAAQIVPVDTLFAQDARTSPNAPISLLCVQADDPVNWGFRTHRPGHTEYVPPIGTVFLITNHTSNAIVASLLSVEVKSGDKWITQMRPHGPFLFSAPESVPSTATNGWQLGRTIGELKGHQTAYSTIHFSEDPPVPSSFIGCGMNYLQGRPTGEVWRLTLSVQKTLQGLADAAARLKNYPEMRSTLHGAGVTNASMNPFSAQYSYFGKPTKVVSPEVPTR